MEFTKSQIAGLVLGYLKSEKCFAAVNEFVASSPYLKEYKNKGKYFITRVSGMCLIDFLEEYANIYSIVQSRLEATNYYDESRKKTTLIEQLIYLLEKEENALVNSTPFSENHESDATLRGNHYSDESDASSHKTPKRKVNRSRSPSNKKPDNVEDGFNVSEVFTQTFLESRELQEKIAETINIVRNTPEVAKPVTDEHISAGASKQVDAIIKTVVQRTEEDPVYNKLIDEIIDTALFDHAPIKKSTPALNPPQQSSSCSDIDDVSRPKRNIFGDKTENQSTNPDTIDHHNNEAVRSIIEVSQNPQPVDQNFITSRVSATSTTTITTTTTNEKADNGVFVFDGSLDTYLKSSGGQNTVAPNPLYFNTGGLIVMPPETTSKQFYIVNNQPLINMNMSTVKGMITDNDILAMPTIIVNDETHVTNQNFAVTNQNFAVTTTTAPPKNPPKRVKNQKIAPKLPPEPVLIETTPKERKKSKTTKGELINSIPTMSSEPSTVVVTASHTTPSVINVPTTKAPTPRQASHVRNLDFSTPSTVKATPSTVKATPTKKKAWDADLRSLVCPPTNKSPTPKRKRPLVGKTKTKKTKTTKGTLEEKLEGEVKTTKKKTDKKEDEEKATEEEDKIIKGKEEEDKIIKGKEEEGKKVKEKEEEQKEMKEKEEEQKKIKEKEDKLKEIKEKEEKQNEVKEKEEKQNEIKEKEEEEKKTDNGEKVVEDHEKVEVFLTTPIKDMIPKTPGLGNISSHSFHCTPFNDVLEEQLRGVDLISIPTPKIPITPGFAITPGLSLTPADLPYASRSTDYSTSSSYYQPSDTEQNKSVEQLIEECRRLESRSPPPLPTFPPEKQLKIISEIVIQPKKKCDDHLKKFNHTVIGKKNLSLLKRVSSSSSSSSDSDSSDVESEKIEERSNKTVICKEESGNKKTISEIIGTVEVKKTLDEETKRKNLLIHLEEVRKRTIDKIKNPPAVKPKTRNAAKPPAAKPPAKIPKRKETKKKAATTTRKKEPSPEETNTDEEAQKLVKGLAQRGIHLIHKKTPQKPGKKEEPIVIVVPPAVAPKQDTKEEDSTIVFDRKVYEEYDLVIHEEKPSKKKNSKVYDLEVLKKGFEARVFAEHLNEEVTRTMRATNFEMLLDLSPKGVSTPRKNKKQCEEEDELMDYVFIGSVREESPETKQTTKGGRKRKSRLSEDGKQVEKKSKTYENDLKLLKKIDVDMFLDKVHGE